MNQTPLGGPLSQASAEIKARDPFRWHMRYWLNLSAIAMIRGENQDLMALRIEMEQEKIPEPALRTHIQRVWSRFDRENRDKCRRSWVQAGNEEITFKLYICELDRMLVHKEEKMRGYLNSLEMAMSACLQSADIPRAKELFDKISRGYRKLLLEEAASFIDATFEDE